MDSDQQHHESPKSYRPAAPLRLLLPIVVVAISAVVALWLMQTGPKTEPRQKVRNATLVDVRPLEFASQTTSISVMGTVIPKREVVIKPQVSGEIISFSDKLVPGGHFSQGEQLLAIDPSDYRLAVRQLSSEVARVEADYQIELGRQRVAQKEFELLGEAVSEEEKNLMLREPQLEDIRASLEGAAARLEQAQLNLQRTIVNAPFNAVVISRDVNLGTSVSMGTPLATLVDSDAFWVEAPVPVSQLKWIHTGEKSNTDGSQVLIYDAAAWGSETNRPGQVIGVMADVEAQGRMAKLLIEVPDPLALQARSSNLSRLLLGSYVRVEIAGQALPRPVAIERDLVHDGNRIWIMDEQGNLDIRTIEITFRDQDQVLVTGGISAGELLVTSNLPSPVQGMSLRVREATAESPAGGEKTRP